MADYIALIHKDENSDYGVSFPDFPGCITAGTDLDDARAMAEEALSFHVEGMIEDGEAIPSPSLLSSVMKLRDNLNAVAFVVSAPAAREKAVRVNVTFPESVLGRIDARATEKGLDRSKYLKEVALADMEA